MFGSTNVLGPIFYVFSLRTRTLSAERSSIAPTCINMLFTQHIQLLAHTHTHTPSAQLLLYCNDGMKTVERKRCNEKNERCCNNGVQHTTHSVEFFSLKCVLFSYRSMCCCSFLAVTLWCMNRMITRSITKKKISFQEYFWLVLFYIFTSVVFDEQQKHLARDSVYFFFQANRRENNRKKYDWENLMYEF